MGIRQIIASGRGSIAAESITGNVVVTGDGNRVAGRGASGNVFSTGGSTTHMISNNLEIISDGSLTDHVVIHISNGCMVINGVEVDLWGSN